MSTSGDHNSTSGDHGSGSGDPAPVNQLSSSDADGAAEESPADSGGVEETKSSDPPDLDARLANPLASTIARLEAVVNIALDKLATGELEQLSRQQEAMMDRLVSLKSGVPPPSSGNPPLSSEPGLKSLAAALSPPPKHVVITPADVKQIPHLSESQDVDVNACLAQYRLVCGFKTKQTNHVNLSEEEIEKLGDAAAFEFCSLICKGSTLSLYQQLMSGSIDWQATVVSPEAPASAGSFVPPKTWKELKVALLDCLMPANNVDESALELANFRQFPHESVSAYALRFRTLCTRFEGAVERATPGRSPYVALSLSLFQAGLSPVFKASDGGEKHPSSLREAIERARRRESWGAMGSPPTTSATSFTRVPNRAAANQFSHAQAPRRKSSGGKSPAGRSTSGGGGSSSSSRNDARGSKNGKQRRTNGTNDLKQDEPRNPSHNRPRCTYDRCKKPLGHTYDTCFQRKRDLKEKNEARKPRDDDIVIVKKRRGRSPPSDDEEEA